MYVCTQCTLKRLSEGLGLARVGVCDRAGLGHVTVGKADVALAAAATESQPASAAVVATTQLSVVGDGDHYTCYSTRRVSLRTATTQ